MSWSEDKASEGEKIDSVVTLHSVSGQFTFLTLAGSFYARSWPANRRFVIFISHFLSYFVFSKYCQIDLNRTAIQSYYTISVLFFICLSKSKNNFHIIDFLFVLISVTQSTGTVGEKLHLSQP